MIPNDEFAEQQHTICLCLQHKHKTRYTHGVAQIKQLCPGNWKEYRPDGEVELSYKSYHESVREMGIDEKKNLMSETERAKYELEQQQKAMVAQAPMKLAGMGVVEANISDATNAALKSYCLHSNAALYKCEKETG